MRSLRQARGLSAGESFGTLDRFLHRQAATMPLHTGRHFLQIPGPTNVPDRVLRAIDQPTIDHRGPEFAALGMEVLAGIKRVFQTRHPVVIYPASGTGAWEAALVNTLSPGDRVLMFETGHFATLWRRMAERLGLEVEFIARRLAPRRRPGCDRGAAGGRPRARDQGGMRGAQRNLHRLRHARRRGAPRDRPRRPSGAADGGHHLVARLHRLPHGRVGRRRHGRRLAEGPDAAAGPVLQRGEREGAGRHPSGAPAALLLELGRDAGIERRPASSPIRRLPTCCYGLREALPCCRRKAWRTSSRGTTRHAEATRRAVRAWGLEVLCAEPGEYSSSLTAVVMPAGHDADDVRKIILERFDMSLGTGLGKLQGKIFRIGHLGHFNDLMLAGTLCGVEMGLAFAGVPIARAACKRRWTILLRP